MGEWNDKIYNQDGSESKRVLRIFAIIILVGVIAWGVGMWMDARHVPQLPGEVMLKGNISLEEADRKVREAGYIPRSEISQDENGHYWQAYESNEVFGYKTVGSVLVIDESTRPRYVSLFLYFHESSKEYKTDNPGKVFNDILNELTGRIGADPVIINETSIGNRLCWDLKEKTTVNLYYVEDGVVSVAYCYAK